MSSSSFNASLFSLLGIIFSTFLLVGCSSPSPQARGSSSSPSKWEYERTGQDWTQIKQTPDSLANLPRPLFYRSAAPTSAIRLTSPDSQVELEAVGGIAGQKAILGLRVHSVVSDRSLIRRLGYVDLYGQRLVMRREDAWRTFWTEGDSLHEERFIPLSISDISRLASADTMRMHINWGQYRLPFTFRRDLQALSQSIPDSLRVDTAKVSDRLTVFHSPEEMPTTGNGIMALSKEIEYPKAALRKEISGKVVIEYLVLPDGSTTRLRIKQPAHPILNLEALEAVKEVEFEAGTYRGQSVPVLMSSPVNFRVR